MQDAQDLLTAPRPALDRKVSAFHNEQFLNALQSWYEERRNETGEVTKGDMAIELAVLELMRGKFELEREDYLTPKRG
ncbi:hypothetical protein [Micromonospora sp. 067-2]|uniref:hypothetical protein n=1 Tax=Micromonospora sp. 067-2 TaxID=2789270 RepID=UPI00397DE814